MRQAALILLLILLPIACSGNTQLDDAPPTIGIKLIDELIACDAEGVWDRSAMMQTLERERQQYVATLELLLSDCRYGQMITPTPAPTRTVDELRSDLCATFRETVNEAISQGLTSEQIVELFLSVGMTQDEIVAMTNNC